MFLKLILATLEWQRETVDVSHRFLFSILRHGLASFAVSGSTDCTSAEAIVSTIEW